MTTAASPRSGAPSTSRGADTAGVRERLVQATADLVRRHGVAGTGVSAIIAASGVARRSLYLHFPGGKAELVEAATRASGEQTTQVLADILTGDQPLAAFVDLWGSMLTSSGYEGGCVVAAAALGRDDAPAAATASAQIYAVWTDALRERLLRRPDTSPDQAAQLASVILSAVEGALVVARARQDLQPLEDVKHCFAWVFERAA